MFYVILWILFAVIGVLIGKGKGRAGAGFALGFFLGPIGLIIIAVMKPNVERVEADRLSSGDRKCPFCAELIRGEARFCKFCGKELPDIVTEEDISGDRGNVSDDEKLCSACGKALTKWSRACPSCGKFN